MKRTWTTKTWIHVKTLFEGFHHWKDAPDEVAFLKNLHRHLFHVKASITVGHDDRELEFFMVKRVMDEYLDFMLKEKKNIVGSCEMVATDLIYYLRIKYGDDRDYRVEVSEDGENSASIEIMDGL